MFIVKYQMRTPPCHFTVDSPTTVRELSARIIYGPEMQFVKISHAASLSVGRTPTPSCSTQVPYVSAGATTM